ncbi:sulfite exporter TauE/SafE family protein [Dongia deserti]|uniref:sulfite exporter TauE/SafE family protein n=1 Tax=Dongia deserti TaxID=2268030 RepID=UPI000E649A29|nr:sulfite exporter TauE/SafE family protein [Dongia deserti]
MMSELFTRQSVGALFFLIVASFIASLARGFSGFGGALIFMPLASAAVGPQAAAPILLVIDGVAQLALLKSAWREADRQEVAIMAAGALIGIPLGAAILRSVDPILLRWAIAALIIAMLALLISGWRYHGRPTPATTGSVGFAAGILSGAVQTAGPPIVAYWLGGSGAALTVRANIILFFFCTSVVAAISYVATGLLGVHVLLLALITAPFYALGMYLGTRMFGLASERLFRRICLALIAGAALVSLPTFDSILR